MGDTWQRLRPWVRHTLRTAAAIGVIAALGVVALELAPAPEPAPPVPITLKLPQLPGTASVAIAPPPTSSIENTVQPAPVVEAAAPAAPVSYADMLRDQLGQKMELQPAPYSGLTVATRDGILPRIGDDRTNPWRAYSRPQIILPQGVAKIAVLMLDAGLSDRLTQPALEQLPGQVSFAYDVYSPNLDDQINAARKMGHEAWLNIPMEPESYPVDDPGPETLLTQLPSAQNLTRLRGFLAKAPGVAGLTSSSGVHYVTDAAAMTPILQDLKRRGLAWVDTSFRQNSTSQVLASQIAMPYAVADMTVDTVLTPAKLKTALDAAAAIAKSKGKLLLVVHPYPLTVSTLSAFIATLPEQNIALVPVTALMNVPSNGAPQP